MNEQEERLKFLEYEVENMKLKLENCVGQESLYLIEKRFCNYAQKNVVEEMRDDLQNKANQKDIAMITDQNEEL